MTRLTAIVGTGLLLFATGSVGGSGLQTSYSHVYLDNVPLGVPTAIKMSNGKGLVIKNTGDNPIHLSASALKPTSVQLREGAEPIPDSAWVRLKPEGVQVLAHSEAEIEVIVLVPDARRHRGRHYQFMIWSRAEPDGKKGFSVTPGLLSRVRIRTGTR